MVTVAIHEFSTGINPERLLDGRWRSRGFKVGEYMNSTLENIPNSVVRAIANKWFEVSQDRNSQEATFIGRTVEYEWSVVAAVSTGQDEYGRSTSFYRYFLCEGYDSLWKIIAWMNNQQQLGKQIVFDPFATQQLGHPHLYEIAYKPELPLPREWQTFLSDNQTPVVIEPGRVPNLQTINAMAEVKANGGPVSWAYNVEAIEHPEMFTIIQAANGQSYQNLAQRRQMRVESAGAMVPSGDRGAMVPSGDRAALKTAINGLSGGSQIKSEWIQTILAALRENQHTQWQEVFDGLGATNALRQGNSNPQMVRLLTLRAFILPETLPEFLEWLKIEDKQKQEKPQQKVSLEFQTQLKNKLNQLPDNFTYGIINALNGLLCKKLSVAAVLWLLTAQGSLWAPYRLQLIEDVRRDLIAINTSFSSNRRAPEPQAFSCGENLWSNLCSCWQNSYRSSIYKPLAELFARLGNSKSINAPSAAYELSAYFYQVSDGAVPTAIFKRALPRERSDEGNIFGLKVKRKIPLPEQGMRFVKEYARIIAIVSLLASSHVATYLVGLKQGQKQMSAIVSPWKREAIGNFTITKNAIESLVRELTQLSDKTPEQDRNKIIETLQETLSENTDMQAKDLNYEKAISANRWEIDWQGEIAAAQGKWVEAIHSYQQRNQQKLPVADGYIEPGKRTYNLLKCDVADSLEIKLKLQHRPQICKGRFAGQDLAEMNEEQIESAINEFSRSTKKALGTLVKELRKEEALKYLSEEDKYKEIVTEIKVALSSQESLNYSGAVQKGDSQQIEILVKGIFSYQQQNGLAADGIIDLDGDTYEVLKEEVREKLLNRVDGGE
ncbi:MAG: hypothetical protein AB4352_09060 [Hormoscilla sp.]